MSDGNGKKPQGRERDTLWKDMTLQQKIGQYKDYYLLPTIVGLALAGFVFYLGWSFIHPDPEPALTVMCIDVGIDDGAAMALGSSLAREMGVKEDLVRVTIADGESYYTPMQISVLMQSGELDVLIASEEYLKLYAWQETLVPLELLFSQEELAKWEEDLVAFAVELPGAEGSSEAGTESAETEEMFQGPSEQKNCGVRLNGKPVWEQFSAVPEADAVCAITSVSERYEAGAEFIRYLMGE